MVNRSTRPHASEEQMLMGHADPGRGMLVLLYGDPLLGALHNSDSGVLPEGFRVVNSVTDVVREVITEIIEGPGLPEWRAGMEPAEFASLQALLAYAKHRPKFVRD